MSEENKNNQNKTPNPHTRMDIIALAILLAFMVFCCIGIPALMGGAQDANGNPLAIAFTETVSAVL